MPKFYTWLYDEKKATKHLKIASVTMQCDPVPEKNRVHMEAWVATVLRQNPDVELILFGETMLGWYAKRGGSKVYHQSIAETIPGETTRWASGLARENGVYLCFGMTEAFQGEIYNSQVLINPQGEIMANHRKFHLMESGSIFKPGTIPATVVDINQARTGIIVCSDIQSAVVRKTLKQKDVDLILGGLANPKDPNFFVSGMIAKMFDSWIVTANRFGDEDGYIYEGDMVVGTPSGRLHRTAVGKEQSLYADLYFLAQESNLKKLFRRFWVSCSFIPYLFRHFGTFLKPRRAKIGAEGSQKS